MKKINLEINIRERWIPHFLSMLAYIETLGKMGGSRKVGIYADGDGDFQFDFTADIKWVKVAPVIDEGGHRLYDAG